MGKIKGRVYPRDITINIGKGEPVPEHPYAGQQWKQVRLRALAGWRAAALLRRCGAAAGRCARGAKCTACGHRGGEEACCDAAARVLRAACCVRRAACFRCATTTP
jgi:hypothetical protein